MDMISKSLQETISGWTEQLIGVPLTALDDYPMPVLTPDREPWRANPLVIIRSGNGSALVATPDLCDAVRPIMPNLHADLVFSPFGTYELARATLPLGITIWGPSFYLFGDRESVRPVTTSASSRSGRPNWQKWTSRSSGTVIKTPLPGSQCTRETNWPLSQRSPTMATQSGR